MIPNEYRSVLVDKPVTTTFEEALELNALAKSQNLIITGYQNRRWDSDYLTLRKLISEGALGDVVDFESQCVLCFLGHDLKLTLEPVSTDTAPLSKEPGKITLSPGMGSHSI